MARPVPPEVRATWPKPNYVNPESRRGLLLGVEIPLIILTFVVMALRMYTRYFIRKEVGLDDWLMALATTMAVALTATNCVSTDFGWGLHLWDFQPLWLVPSRKLVFACQFLFVLCSCFTKLSILAFYLHIFTTRTLRVLAYIGVGVVGAWGICFIFAVIFHCIPINAYWDLQITERKCINETAVFLASGVLNTVTDFFVFILPIRTVWTLKLPKRQRIGLIAIFAIGVIVCVAGIMRIWAIKLVLIDSYDNTWEGALLYVFTAIECNLGIICASIPALKPFFTHFFPGLLSTQGQSTAGGAGGLGGISGGNKYQLNNLTGKMSVGPGYDRRGRNHYPEAGYGAGITVHVQGGNFEFDRESRSSGKYSVADSTTGPQASNRSEEQIITGHQEWDSDGTLRTGGKRKSGDHNGIAIEKQIRVEVQVSSANTVEFDPNSGKLDQGPK